MFNALDVLLLVGLMAILGAAFFGGISHTFSSILAVYLAAIVAGSFYDDLTNLARHYLTLGKTTGELSFFVVLFLVFSALFTFVISRWLEGMRMPRWFTVVDSIGGAVLGLLVAGAAVTVAAMLLSILVQALNQVALQGQGPLVDLVDGQVQDSALVPFFLRLSPFFLNLVEPWFPGGLPRLLTAVS
jgi:uncharacterized membrane protein required for colicin V production